MLLERFRRETGIEDPAAHFDYDYRQIGTVYRPLALDRERYLPDLPPEGSINEWGIGIVPWPDNPGFTQVVHPFRRFEDPAEVDAFPRSEVDLDAMRHAAAAVHAAGRLAVAHSGSIYELARWYRSMEEFLVDLAIRPEMANRILDMCAELTLGISLALAAAGVDILAFYDDFGMQTGLQISPVMWRAYVKPRWAAVLGAIRSAYPGALFFLHTCGRIEEIVDDLVELGFDLLHPLQPECNDLEAVAARVRGRLTVWGTISNQRTLPFGSRDDLRREIEQRIALFGRRGGLVLSPSNIMGPEIPVANVLALAELCAELCGSGSGG